MIPTLGILTIRKEFGPDRRAIASTRYNQQTGKVLAYLRVARSNSNP